MVASFSPAARLFLEHEAARSPDFSACLILVPHHHAAQGLRLALSQATGTHLLPPRLCTLPQLVQQRATPVPVVPASRRLAELHGWLRRAGMVPETGLWAAAQEIAELFDQLDLERVGGEALAAQPRGNPYLSQESALVSALWSAFRDETSAAQHYARALQTLAEQAAQPLYTLGLAGLTGAERAFLAAWSARAPVIDLPVPVARADRGQLAEAVWVERAVPLVERARQFAAQYAVSPLAGCLTVTAADHLEATAQAAEAQLLAWLREGRREIAVLAVDRLLARRLRALAERRGILMRDETGWTLSTSSVSHVVECWLRLSGRSIAHRDLLDLLKSPLVLSDSAAARELAARQLEQAWRVHGAPTTLEQHLALARDQGLTQAADMLRRLIVAQDSRPAKRAPLAAWTTWLAEALQHIGARAALLADPIGRPLLDLIERLVRETAPLTAKVELADWRTWLLMQLEQATFTDETVDSPIRLTHPLAARLRDWEAVLVLGADARQLPPRPRAGLCNDAVRRQLGLPESSQQEQTLRAALMDILVRSEQIAFFWQRHQGGEPQALSPWLIGLDAFHRAAWGAGLASREALPAAPLAAPDTAPSWPAAPGAPARLSVSAWQRLVACPYRYFTDQVLGLRAPDAVPEELDKSDYGGLVHAILARFHGAHPVLADATPEALEADLRELSQAVFAAAGQRRYLDALWTQRWLGHIPGYLAWARAWEAAGHGFVSAETPLEQAVAWSDTGQSVLYGRADRIDQGPAGLAILDYKTGANLARKAEANGEDVQLPAYAWLAGAGEAAFVAIDQDKVKEVRFKGDLAQAIQAEGARLVATFAALAAGATLPANGAPATCAWCEMRGLCRREPGEA